MGDYAELTIDDQIDSWDGRSSALYGLGPLGLKQAKKCNRCGYGGLYWIRREGKWRLHHYTMLPNASKPSFVLHKCGFDSWGRRKDQPHDQ